jgi:hypothetical protein
MILSDEELNLRLDSDINLCTIDTSEKESHPENVTVVQLPKEKSPRGDAIPPLVRQLLAVTANSSSDTQEEVGNVFGVGNHVVSEYSRGLVARRADSGLRQVADKARTEAVETAHELAIDNLLETLQILKPKLATIDTPKALAKVAVDMSRVVNTLNNTKRPEENETKPLVIIHSVHSRPEKSYDVIDI